MELTYIYEEIFLAEVISPYPEREANPATGPGRVQDRSRAMFKLDEHGKVQTLGIELESAMVAKAAAASKKAKDGVHD